MENNQTTRIKPSLCPQCFKMLDSATSTTGSKWEPGPGDETVCCECATMLRFENDLTVRRLTGEELAELERNDFQRFLALMEAALVVSIYLRTHAPPPPKNPFTN